MAVTEAINNSTPNIEQNHMGSFITSDNVSHCKNK